MIKLFSLKQQKKDEESAGGNRAGAGGKKASAAQLRIQKGRLVSPPTTPSAALPPSLTGHRKHGTPGPEPGGGWSSRRLTANQLA